MGKLKIRVLSNMSQKMSGQNFPGQIVNNFENEKRSKQMQGKSCKDSKDDIIQYDWDGLFLIKCMLG